MEINKHNKFSVFIGYEITLACNNRCDYCHILNDLDNSKTINEHIYNTTIEKILDFSDKNPEYSIDVDVIGGDPLVVVDKTIDFISKLQKENINISVLTNLNFNPESSNVKKILDALKKYNFKLTISWHKSSNVDYIKRNLMLISEITSDLNVLILMDDSNLDSVYQHFLWVKEYTKFNVYHKEIINADIKFTRYDDVLFKKMNSMITLNEFILKIDDKNVDINDYVFFKTFQSQYMKKCKLSGFNIKFNGDIISRCRYEIKSNIENGIQFKDVICYNDHCGCNDVLYKKIIKKKSI